MSVRDLLQFVIFNYIFALVISSPCKQYKNCGDCIRDSTVCQWCAMDDFNGTRCIPANEVFEKCDENSIENIQSSGHITSSKEYSSEPDNVIQITPQRYKMKLRPGQNVDFHLSFKAAENYPADIYFLIDSSSSMTSIQKEIVKASKKIYIEMQKHTENVYLGLGSFVDKNALPYIFAINSSDPIASFRHHLSLTGDYTKFKNAVSEIILKKNDDDPEGGFDGIAQAIVCKERIGWRTQSRKIIIYITDNLYHTAGDGKLAGIIQPYDGKCYTDVNGTYTKELEMDYPSISIINKLATENDVSIIFFTNQASVYETLTTSIRGSRHVSFTKYRNKVQFNGHMSIVLSNIYKELSHTIKLKEYMTSTDRNVVNVTFSPDCTGIRKDDSYLQRNCKVQNRMEKTINGSIHLSKYNGKNQISIELAIEGIHERLNIDIEVIACDCESNKSKIEKNSEYCSHEGTKICGLCECNANRVGDKCGCSEHTSLVHSDDHQCMGPAMDAPCSGHGACLCGTCNCQRGFRGRFCECNDFSCPNMCSGRGTCECGECRCNVPGWTGKDCDCLDQPCKTNNGKTCNGRGICKCGNCQCDQLAVWDGRRVQTEDCVLNSCADCHSKQCQKLKDCAICHHRNLKKNETGPCVICHEGIKIHTSANRENISLTDIFTCQDVALEMGCYTAFQYWYNDDEYTINLFVQRDANCLETYYVYGGIILGTILLGGILALVIWKVVTNARDRKEYERFLEQHKSDTSGPCENPIYEPACTTFHNPAFRKRSVDVR